jgi:hypothetical protein
VERKKRADPDAKLLEHRGVTISELATELNGGRGRAGQGVYNTKVNISVWRILRRRVADPAFRFRESFDLLVIHGSRSSEPDK